VNKKHAIAKILLALLLLMVITISSLGASRTVSSKTLYIYGYVPERTTLNVLENGDIDYFSNNPYATVDVAQSLYSTTLSVTAL
jgi:hypothetical protein